MRARGAAGSLRNRPRSAAGAASDDTSAPGVLLFPPGGFGLPSSSEQMSFAMAAAREAGFRPIEVHYPIWDPIGAWKYAMQTAHRTRAQFAYGESAGGTLAGRLAQVGLVERASLNAPISDLFTWPFPETPELGLPYGWGMNMGDRLHLSPKFNDSASPIDIIHSVDDDIVPFTDSVIWTSRDPKVTLRVVDGPHIAGPTYDRKLRLSFELLRGLPASWGQEHAMPL